ncbi:MAG: molybdopterin molybdotransferase MoeA [Zestosphaera sp.]
MSRRRLEGFTRFEEYENALSKLLTQVNVALELEKIPVSESSGRIAAEDLYSLRDYPPVDRAALDGYAVRSLDVLSASPSNPVILKIVGSVEAGEVPKFSINAGEAAIVFTGAPIPEGSDSVVPFEEAVRRGNLVHILRPVQKYKNVSRAGEDIKTGDLIIRRGIIIRPWHIAALIEAGFEEVKVFKRPRIGIINVGNELIVEEGNKIPNSTGPLIYAYLKELGCEPVLIGVVPDDEEEILNTILRILRDFEILITTGGTSVGGKDLVPEALSRISGANLIFHGVNLRPGRTTGAYVIEGKPILMFSGLPVAALVGLEAFVKPLIRHLTGATLLPEPTARVKVRRRVTNVVGFKSFFRVVVYREGGELSMEPLRLTGSGIISTLLRGNAILVVNENIEGYDEGDYVDVVLIGPIYEKRPEFLE